MGDGLRTLRLVTGDESLLATLGAAARALEGWELAAEKDAAALLARPPAPGDVILLDGELRSPDVYELCRELTGRTRCRTFVVTHRGNRWASAIAQFCGATGVLERPLSAAALRKVLESTAPRGDLPRSARSVEAREPILPDDLVRGLQARRDEGGGSVISALTDPETGLFAYAFLDFKLDEEFKRAQRFGYPLSCVMLGFEGQATEQVLRELSGIFLTASRDTDVLGRFDENSFLFLLPHTGLDGARVMAGRVEELARARGLRDLVGDPLRMSVGIACHPHTQIRRREDLYDRARQAFLSARSEGGGVVTAS